MNLLDWKNNDVYLITQDHEQEQINFLKSLTQDLSNFKENNIIIGRDFNLYLSQQDKNEDNYKQNTTSKIMNYLMEHFNLSYIVYLART